MERSRATTGIAESVACNLILTQLLQRTADKLDLLYAEVSAAQGGAEWMICSPSGEGDLHANDLGHRVIANKIFEVLANNCSWPQPEGT